MWLGIEACLLGESNESGGLQQKPKPLRGCGWSSSVPGRAQEQVMCPWAQPCHKHQGWRNWRDRSIVVQRTPWESDRLWEGLPEREGDGQGVERILF